MRTPGDDAGTDITTRNRADPWNPEDLAHLGLASYDLFVLWLEHTAFEQVVVLAAGPEPEYQRLVGIYRGEADRLMPLRVVPEEVAQ